MLYKSFRDTGIKISRLGMGCMRLPMTDKGEIIYEESEKILDYAIENGINYFDTAYVYNKGDSELCTGRALSRHPRESYMLATKIPAPLCGSPQQMEEALNTQLERLRTDYIDFYLLHNLCEATVDALKKPHVLETALRFKREGKIRFLGFSSHGDPEMLQGFLALSDWDFVQIQLNYFDWSYQNAERQLEILRGCGMPVMVMEPVRGGRLASISPKLAEELNSREPGVSPASIALRWAAGFDGVQVVLSGMSSMEQIRENIATFSDLKPINEYENDFSQRAAKALRDEALIPCTGCRYCVDDCPAGLDIPKLLEVSNEHILSRVFFSLFPILRLPDDKRPAACTACRSCVSHCPQGIDIPERLAELSGHVKNMPPPPPNVPV